MSEGLQTLKLRCTLSRVVHDQTWRLGMAHLRNLMVRCIGVPLQGRSEIGIPMAPTLAH